MPPDMLRAAIDGHYDDYLSPLAMPQLQLVMDLRALAAEPTTGAAVRAAISALISRVINGDFDGTLEEAEAWAASPEGQETLRDVLGAVRQRWARRR